MKDPLQPNHCAELLNALAAPERLRIVRLLREGPHTVSDIAETLDKAPLANVSHHLSVLHQARLVRREKKGRFVLYSLAPGVMQEDETGGHVNLGCCRLELPREG